MQLAQLNIAVGVHPMEDARMEPFTGRINAINALSDRSEGFVWRLTDDDPDTDGALGLHLPDEANVLVNMSVWATVESLFSFVYKTAHAKVMTDNRDNFEDLSKNHYVLWWVEDGHIPTLIEAKAKLDYLHENGPSPDAFTFRVPFSELGTPLELNFSPTNLQKDCA